MEDSIIAFEPYLTEPGIGFDKAEYEIIRNSILKHLIAYGVMTVDELDSLVKSHLRNKFAGSLYKHYESVRQVLEVRGEVRLVPKTSPQLIEITELFYLKSPLDSC